LKDPKSFAVGSDPEMEFLDINLAKDSSLLLHTIHSHFYWRILKKLILFSGFKTHYKKFYETRKLGSLHEYHFVERKNEGRKTKQNLESEKIRV
jgi:hypothetical protein